MKLKSLKTVGESAAEYPVFLLDYNETEYYPDLFARALKELDLLRYGSKVWSKNKP